MLRSWFISLLFVLTLFTDVLAAGRSDLGGPFELIDQDGKTVTEKDFLGTPVLLYFGFTSCPDICPVDLAKLAAITRTLASDHAIQVAPVFVSIDPERDTPARLKEYVPYFHNNMTGLTGSDAAVARMADHYAVYYKRVPLDDAYTMDHSTFMFLLGQDGEYLDHYGRKVTTAEMVKRIVNKLGASRL